MAACPPPRPRSYYLTPRQRILMLRLILFLLGLMRRVWLYAWDLDILLSGDVFFLLCLWHHDVLLAAVCYCSAATDAAAHYY